MTVLINRPDVVPEHALLPTLEPLSLIDRLGRPSPEPALVMPDGDRLLALHAAMVSARRFDTQATALTRQGRLAVYPSARGQEAAEIGATAALRAQDWLFPTYRDSIAIAYRGVEPSEVLSLLRGDWHCGYDPYAHRVAPQCTPLATNALHAVGFAHAARLQSADTVALVMVGDGATSEGDTHEALNFAAVWRAPVIFLVQNNGYAISVPTAMQSAAPTLAHKGIGYGIPSVRVDGNDAAAVFAVVSEAVERGAGGGGPTLIEAVTYRIEAHTNADDATRYRDEAEVSYWRDRDPIDRLRRYLSGLGLFDEAGLAALTARAEEEAAALREVMNRDRVHDPDDLFEHVYVEPTAALLRQRHALHAELDADLEALGDGSGAPSDSDGAAAP